LGLREINLRVGRLGFIQGLRQAKYICPGLVHGAPQRFLIDPRENFPLDHLLPGRDAQFDQGHTINVEAHVQPVHSLYLASRRDRGGQAAPANGHDLRRRLGGLRRAVTQLPIDSAPRDYHGQGHYPSVSLPEAHAPPRLSTVPRVPRQPSRAATEWTAR